MSTPATNTLICPLTEFGLIRFSGEDTQSFLQGQLSNDTRQVGKDNFQYACHSTAKGRMLANCLVFRDGEDFLLQVSADLQSSLQKKLSMYILRSKVRASADNHVLLGLTGPQAANQLQNAFGITAGPAGSAQRAEDLLILALDADRFEIVAPAEQGEATKSRLISAGALPGTLNDWQLAEIRAGKGWITTATQEEFIAQMINLDLLQGISFTKGCYTGQEIIARTQYLGKLKRRMYRVSTTSPVSAGDSVFSPEMQGQASGRILNTAQAGDGQWEALAVIQMSSLEHGLHLGTADGPALSVLTLPYAID
jgi:folate-binding protein YgfZ